MFRELSIVRYSSHGTVDRRRGTKFNLLFHRWYINSVHYTVARVLACFEIQRQLQRVSLNFSRFTRCICILGMLFVEERSVLTTYCFIFFPFSLSFFLSSDVLRPSWRSPFYRQFDRTIFHANTCFIHFQSQYIHLFLLARSMWCNIYIMVHHIDLYNIARRYCIRKLLSNS